MALIDLIKRQWERSSDDLTGSDAFWERSAMTLSLLQDMRRLVSAHVQGKLLDVGAGKLPYRRVVTPYCTDYSSIDFRKTHPELDYVGDAQALPLPDANFNTVICIEVLEHVPDPSKALGEIYRVLKPGGKLVLSVPHLMYLHNEPNDFFRYTKYGLRVLLERAGFKIIIVEPSGGLAGFLQGLVATTGVGLTYGLPLIWPLFYQVNRLVSRCAVWLDNHTDKRKLFALHFVAVAQKP